MKKCSAICVYSRKNNRVFNFGVQTKIGYIKLIGTRDFDSFYEIYEVALSTAKMNGYCIKSWNDFDTLFYDINFLLF